MKKFLLFLLMAGVHLSAQITFKITSVPANTPPGATIYIAGNFNGWNPGSTPMVPDGNGNYTYTLAEGSGTVEYKFTRGAWASAEGNAAGGYLPNRTATFTGSPQTLNLTVQSWEDLGGGNPSTAASNVHVMSEAFAMPQLNRTRKIWIYLPPDYETSSKTYPVIYMQDGQNLFDNATAFAGEWQVDETLNSLFAQGDYGAIVIGIENGGGNRINEYTPWNNSQYGGGEGSQYMDFVAQTLKPYVDANYRTKTGREYTALIGSSLGGLISTYGSVKYSDVFSKVGSFSPAYWIVRDQLDNYLATTGADLSALRIYFVAGSNESSTMSADIESVKNRLQAKGLSAANTKVKLDSYGQHNEAYWRGEFAAAYQWLFAGTQLSTKETVKKKVSVAYSKGNLVIDNLPEKTEAKIFDMSGKLVKKLYAQNGENPLQRNLATGRYVIQIGNETARFLVR